MGLEGWVGLVLRASRQRPLGDVDLGAVGHWRVLSVVDTLGGVVKRSGGSGVGGGSVVLGRAEEGTSKKKKVVSVLQTINSIAVGFPGGAVVENLPANAGDTGSSPGLGRSHMPRSN